MMEYYFFNNVRFLVQKHGWKTQWTGLSIVTLAKYSKHVRVR